MIRMTRTILTLAALHALLSVSASAEDYFPSQKDNEWTYGLSWFPQPVPDFTTKVVASRTFSRSPRRPHLTAALYENLFGEVDSWVFQVGKQVFYRGDHHRRFQLFARFRPRPSHWRSDLFGLCSRCPASSAAGLETIVTPAGTFDNCVRLTWGNLQPATYTGWFAPDVGLVRLIKTELLGSPETGSISFRSHDLLSARVNGSTFP